MKKFEDYKNDAHNWITLSTGEYYPDILVYAVELYKPVLVLFSKILKESASSTDLFTEISKTKDSWMRVQLARVFRKYVSPETPVEMLKRKTKAQEICEQFGKGFRPINEVQNAFDSRPIEDEALCAVLWEYKDRGKKGYDLTEKFARMIEDLFPNINIHGPERAGKDIALGDFFSDYPFPKRPVDFVLTDKDNKKIYAIVLARYDSDRGGAQEDDRTGGYRNCADEILTYTNSKSLDTKVIFLNDGPGLLLGSMWDDYSEIEGRWDDQIKVVTLRMINDRITQSWLIGEK